VILPWWKWHHRRTDSTMPHLFPDTQDPYRFHGIRHFLETQGLPEYEDEPRATIGYDESCTIQVSGGRMLPKPAGWLEYKCLKVPLYEEPVEAAGEPIAVFHGEKSYPCVAEEGDRIKFGFDIFNAVGRILSGHLETAYCPSEAAEIPFLDIYEEILFDCLVRVHNKAGVPLVRKARWPNGAPYAVCLTHDVDEVRKIYQHVTAPLKSLVLGKPKEALTKMSNSLSDILHGRDPYWTFEELIRLENELGVKSSLYFLEEKGRFTFKDLKSFFLMARRYEFTEPNIAAMLRKLDAGGWDVGVHGSYNSYNNPALFNTEKERLEKVLGHPTTGTRQHHLNFTIPKTWEMHAASGLKYDCSMGYKDKPGFRWATSLPFHPLNAKTLKPIGILEIPTVIMDTPLFYIKADPQETINRVRDTVNSHGGLLTLLWHHTVFNEREFPGWTERYHQTIQEAKKDGAWIGRGHDLATWWEKRKQGQTNAPTSNEGDSIERSPTVGIVMEKYTRAGITICSGNGMSMIKN
jgi:hypothetical protein